MKRYLLSLCLAIFLIACAQELPQWDGPTLSQPRDQLTVEQLQQQNLIPLLDMSFFAEPEWAQEAEHSFSGSIALDKARMMYPKEREAYTGEDEFPPMTIEFISHGGDLIPVRRDRIIVRQESDVYWDIILGAGRVWQEVHDAGWSRASFPLSLTDRYIGQIRNCVATFVYDSVVMSNVYLQCSQETADLSDNQVGDIRAMLPASYEPAVIANAEELVQQHTRAESARLATEPLSSIDTDGEIAAYFDKALTTHAATSQGAILQANILYVHPPNTRHGPYPYPDEMRHGVYSVTTSMAGALALLYFAERYDTDIFDARITDYVPALANHPAWQGVTFSHALNMATGTEGSESTEHLLNILILANSAEESIMNIATLGNYPEVPGEQFNYASTNIFVLSYALQNYVQAKESEQVLYWDLVHENVLKPIGADHFTVLHTLESDGSEGIPYLAFGATPTLDEAAKIALLFANEGVHDGRQLLNKAVAQEAIGNTDWDGYATNDLGISYRHSFRATTLNPARGCQVDVSFMLGDGANHVLFLPKNIIVLRFMDEYDFQIDVLVRSVHEQLPLCP